MLSKNVYLNFVIIFSVNNPCGFVGLAQGWAICQRWEEENENHRCFQWLKTPWSLVDTENNCREFKMFEWNFKWVIYLILLSVNYSCRRILSFEDNFVQLKVKKKGRGCTISNLLPCLICGVDQVWVWFGDESVLTIKFCFAISYSMFRIFRT